MDILRTAPGVIVAPASDAPDAARGAYEVAHGLAANLRYLRRRPASARPLDGPAPEPGVFDVIHVDGEAPPDVDLPVLLVASEHARSVTPPDRWVLGVVARGRPVPTGPVEVLGVFPPIPGGPEDPVWLGKVADHLESRVDLWPVLQVAAPGQGTR